MKLSTVVERRRGNGRVFQMPMMPNSEFIFASASEINTEILRAFVLER